MALTADGKVLFAGKAYSRNSSYYADIHYDDCIAIYSGNGALALKVDGTLVGFSAMPVEEVSLFS